VTFEQAAVGIDHFDLDGRFLRVNQKFCEIVGYSAEELLNLRFQDITFPDDLAANLNYVRSLLADEIENYEMDKRYIRKDGAIIWGHQTVSLVRDSTGKPKHFVAVIEDISDRQLAEEQLERSLEELRWKEALLQSMTSASPLAFYVVDNCTDTIVYFNHRFCEIWKIEHLEEQLCQGEFKNTDLFPHCLPLLTDTSAFVNTYKALQLQENRAVVEDEIALVDGRTLRFFSTQIRDKFDRYFGRLYLFEDVSDRKQAEETLRQQYLKERLIGAIAQRIHQSLNLEDILNITVAEVRQFLACDRTIIYRLHADGSGVVVVESVGSEWIPISGTVINDRYFADIYIQLYQQGRVQSVEDIYNAGLTQCHIDLLAWFQVRANLVVPIVHEQRLWGLLVAQQCSETRQWQSLEIDLLKSLATQVAIAIQQSELYQQAQTEILQRQQVEEALQQQFQREHLVAAIAQRIRQSLNLEQILERTVTEVRQVLQTDRVIIFRFQPDWSGKVVVESVNAHWSSILGEIIHDPCFKDSYIAPYQQGRIKAIEDIHTANLSQCHIDLLTRFQVRANLVVPILHKDQLWGLLIVHHCSEPRQWQSCEMDLLKSLASQAAIAIQQSQLYTQAQSQAKREQALNQVTQAIRSSLDLKTIFSTATREIVELLQLDRAKIVQYLPERKVWVHVSEYYKAPEFPITVGQEIPDENNEIAQRLKQLEIVKIDDTNTIESEINKDLAKAFPGAWLLVPLHFGSSVWGSITLVKETIPYYWQDAEVELIRAIADQVAIAIHQSQLYAQARYHLLREQALNLLTQAIRRSLDLETIFSTATHEIGQLLQVDHVHIVQYLPNRKVWVNVAESCKRGCSALGIGLEIADDHNDVTERLKRLEVVRIEDTQSVEDEMNRRISQQFSGAWLLVPLHFGSSVWGALGLVFDVGPY
ncbi:MAG TPA: GAF domain-containing protein, partial [Cyanophyceae cyanobacterium]